MSAVHEPSTRRRPETLLEVLQKILFVNGWSRVLLAESVPDTRLCRIRLKDAGASGDFSDADTVGLYSEEEFREGRVTRQAIQAECRRFVTARG